MVELRLVADLLMEEACLEADLADELGVVLWKSFGSCSIEEETRQMN